MVSAPFVIHDTAIQPGERRTVDIPVSVLSNHTQMNMSVHVVHSKRPGPVLLFPPPCMAMKSSVSKLSGAC